MFKRYKVKKIIEKRSGDEAVIEVNQVVSGIFYRNKSLLSYEELTIAYLEQLEVNIHSGGFYYFFWNQCGGNVIETLQALKDIKSIEYLRIFEEAIDLFPRENVPKNIDIRQNAIKRIEDEAIESWKKLDKEFSRYEENLHGLILEYITENVDGFR